MYFSSPLLLHLLVSPPSDLHSFKNVSNPTLYRYNKWSTMHIYIAMCNRIKNYYYNWMVFQLHIKFISIPCIHVLFLFSHCSIQRFSMKIENKIKKKLKIVISFFRPPFFFVLFSPISIGKSDINVIEAYFLPLAIFFPFFDSMENSFLICPENFIATIVIVHHLNWNLGIWNDHFEWYLDAMKKIYS